MMKRTFIALMLIVAAAPISQPAFAQNYDAIVAAPDSAMLIAPPTNAATHRNC